MGWQKARDAAWREFGRRYWKLLVGLEIARRSAPTVLAGLTVAAVGAGVWWLVTHAPPAPSLSMPEVDAPGRWWHWVLGSLAVVLTGWWVARRRNPYMPPNRGRRLAAAAVAFAAAAVAVLLWRNA
jgi:hypothetical protein